MIRLLVTLLFLLLSSRIAADNLRAETYVAGMGIPWGMVWLPDGDLLVNDRKGKITRLRNRQSIATIRDVPDVHASGQGGLLDIELHPDYQENGWLYLTYSDKAGEGSNTALMRARLSKNRLVDQEVLYKAAPDAPGGRHYGSRIEFDSTGHLYFSVGDRGARDRFPQDLSLDGGKIYRLNDDGTIPEDNPFVGTAGARTAIFSLGHRNPQGMARHPETGAIWIHEHGPRGGDELNLIRSGRNYGWPILSYGINYSGSSFAEGTEREGYESPRWYWVPSIAPSGMTFVTSDKYRDWQGHLLVGSLKFGYLVLCRLEGDRVTDTEIVLQGIGRVRNVRQGPDGFIYVGLDSGEIKRLLP